MRAGTGFWALCFLVIGTALGIAGCAAAPVAVAGASSGISFTSTTATRSFTYSVLSVHAAVLQALERMDIMKTKDEKSGDGFKMKGKTKRLTIYITLASITPTVAKVSINARRYWFMKDQTVAAEILVQTAKVLERAGLSSLKVLNSSRMGR